MVGFVWFRVEFILSILDLIESSLFRTKIPRLNRKYFLIILFLSKLPHTRSTICFCYDVISIILVMWSIKYTRVPLSLSLSLSLWFYPIFISLLSRQLSSRTFFDFAVFAHSFRISYSTRESKTPLFRHFHVSRSHPTRLQHFMQVKMIIINLEYTP